MVGFVLVFPAVDDSLGFSRPQEVYSPVFGQFYSFLRHVDVVVVVVVALVRAISVYQSHFPPASSDISRAPSPARAPAAPACSLVSCSADRGARGRAQCMCTLRLRYG